MRPDPQPFKNGWTALAWIGKYFDIGPVPMSGATSTVKQTTLRIAPPMRLNADRNILVGQSGQILSSHYRDQWDAYYAGRSFPMQFTRVEAKKTLEFRPAR